MHTPRPHLPTLRPSLPHHPISQQKRHATLLRRPRRPYTFTQLLTLSDGSTSVQRTTSPLPIYRSARDTRNTLMWNPSNARMANVEEDEAGRLAAFRKRFGRGWDVQGQEVVKATGVEEDEVEIETENAQEEKKVQGEDGWGDNLMDLISGYGKESEEEGKDEK